jgi:DNA-directed RNA polymerase sigma subunit (sigma70/sigma32)
LPCIIRKIHRYWLKHDEDPSVEWVMEKSRCSTAIATLALKYSHPRYLSLSDVEVVGVPEEYGEDMTFRQDVIDSLSFSHNHQDTDEQLMNMVKSTCTDRQAEAISLVSGLSGEDSMTYREAGTTLGISGERVRQLCRAGANEMVRSGSLEGFIT